MKKSEEFNKQFKPGTFPQESIRPEDTKRYVAASPFLKTKGPKKGPHKVKPRGR